MNSDPFDTLPIRMGLAYAATGSRAEAIASYRQALADDPDSFAAQFLLGVEAYVDQEWEEAFRRFVATIERAPALAEPFYNLGLVYWHQRDFASAQKCWEKAISLRVRFPQAILAMGTAYLASRRLPEALTCCEQAILLWETPETLNALGATLFHSGQFHEAGTCFEKAAGRAPHLAAPLRNLAVLYRARGQEQEAQHCLNQASSARDPSGFFIAPLHLLLPLARRIGVSGDATDDDGSAEPIVYDLDEVSDWS